VTQLTKYRIQQLTKKVKETVTCATYCWWFLVVLFIIFCVTGIKLIRHPYFVVISSESEHIDWLQGETFDFEKVIFTLVETETELSFFTKFRLFLLNLLPAKTFFFIHSARHGTPFGEEITPYHAIQPWIGFIHSEPLHILFYDTNCDVMLRIDRRLTRNECHDDPEAAFERFVEVSCIGLDNSTVIVYHNVDSSYETLEDVLDETRKISIDLFGFLLVALVFLLVVFSYSRRSALTIVISSVLVQMIVDPVSFRKPFSYVSYFSTAVTPETDPEQLFTPALMVEIVLISIFISIFCLCFYYFFTLELKKRFQIVGVILAVAILFNLLRDPLLYWHTLVGLFD